MAHMKRCAEMYQKEKEEKEKAQKKHPKKTPQAKMTKGADAKVQKQWAKKWSAPP